MVVYDPFFGRSNGEFGHTFTLYILHVVHLKSHWLLPRVGVQTTLGTCLRRLLALLPRVLCTSKHHGRTWLRVLSMLWHLVALAVVCLSIDVDCILISDARPVSTDCGNLKAWAVRPVGLMQPSTPSTTFLITLLQPQTQYATHPITSEPYSVPVLPYLPLVSFRSFLFLVNLSKINF